MSAAVEPPIDSLNPEQDMPLPVLPRSSVPLTSEPRKFPVTVVLPPETFIPSPVKRLITKPRTVDPVELTVSPVTLAPALAPSSSTLRTALSPAGVLLAVAPVCE